jgi:hypothetical protein
LPKNWQKHDQMGLFEYGSDFAFINSINQFCREFQTFNKPTTVL